MMPADMNWIEVVELIRTRKGPRGLGEPGNY